MTNNKDRRAALRERDKQADEQFKREWEAEIEQAQATQRRLVRRPIERKR